VFIFICTFIESVHSGFGSGTGGIFPAHNRDDEVSSTSSEKYERDVTILNHCFDDIEKFIARLQHAAAASRELERRRRLVVLKKLALFMCKCVNFGFVQNNPFDYICSKFLFSCAYTVRSYKYLWWAALHMLCPFI
jgi:hypothetical protein